MTVIFCLSLLVLFSVVLLLFRFGNLGLYFLNFRQLFDTLFLDFIQLFLHKGLIPFIGNKIMQNHDKDPHKRNARKCLENGSADIGIRYNSVKQGEP